MGEVIKCDYPRREGSKWVCPITGFSSYNRGKLAEQCPVKRKNECAQLFAEKAWFRGFNRTVGWGQGRDG